MSNRQDNFENRHGVGTETGKGIYWETMSWKQKAIISNTIIFNDVDLHDKLLLLDVNNHGFP